jgi:hypothetical protein
MPDWVVFLSALTAKMNTEKPFFPVSWKELLASQIKTSFGRWFKGGVKGIGT